MNLSKTHMIIIGAVILVLMLGFGMVSLMQMSGKKAAPKVVKEEEKEEKAQDAEITANDEETIGILPEGSDITAPLPTAPSLPKIEVAEDTQKVQTAAPKKTQQTTGVAIDPSLFNQGPPEEAEREERDLIPVKVIPRPGYYLFNNFTPQALAGQKVIYQSETHMFSLDHFSPAGETIEIAFMTNVASNEGFEVPVSAAVWSDFYFQGNRLLEVGVKLMGRAGQKSRDRLLVQFDKIVFKDGRTLPLSAVALDLDGTSGVKGYLIGDKLLSQLGIIIAEGVGTFLEDFTDETVEKRSTYEEETTKQTFASAAGDTIKDMSKRIQETIQEELEEKSYLLVPAGTRAKAYLTEPLDVSRAAYGQ